MSEIRPFCKIELRRCCTDTTNFIRDGLHITFSKINCHLCYQPIKSLGRSDALVMIRFHISQRDPFLAVFPSPFSAYQVLSKYIFPGWTCYHCDSVLLLLLLLFTERCDWTNTHQWKRWPVWALWSLGADGHCQGSVQCTLLYGINPTPIPCQIFCNMNHFILINSW